MEDFSEVVHYIFLSGGEGPVGGLPFPLFPSLLGAKGLIRSLWALAAKGEARGESGSVGDVKEEREFSEAVVDKSINALFPFLEPLRPFRYDLHSG